ncbi:MAG: hypothetical protein KDA80_20100 [Planctomycetaceae bacterium]|nr:hypothetical protein [Planctomycetaceae bacterium]
MRIPFYFLATLCLVPALMFGEDTSTPKFLNTGEDFAIQFAVATPFQKTVRRPMDRNSDSPRNEFRRPGTITYSVDIFKVVGLPGGSWVLLEHPKSIEDAPHWNAKRLAMATLTPQAIIAMESTEDGRKRLEKLREQAAVEIETSRTWVNMQHMLTIKKPPIQQTDFDPKTLTTPGE